MRTRSALVSRATSFTFPQEITTTSQERTHKDLQDWYPIMMVMRRNPLHSGLGTNIWIGPFTVEEIHDHGPSRLVSQTGRLEWSIRLTLDPSTIQLQVSNQSQKNPSKQKIPKKRRRKTPKELFRERCFKKDGSRKKKPESKLPIDQRKAYGR